MNLTTRLKRIKKLEQESLDYFFLKPKKTAFRKQFYLSRHQKAIAKREKFFALALHENPFLEKEDLFKIRNKESDRKRLQHVHGNSSYRIALAFILQNVEKVYQFSLPENFIKKYQRNRYCYGNNILNKIYTFFLKEVKDVTDDYKEEKYWEFYDLIMRSFSHLPNKKQVEVKGLCLRLLYNTFSNWVSLREESFILGVIKRHRTKEEKAAFKVLIRDDEYDDLVNDSLNNPLQIASLFYILDLEENIANNYILENLDYQLSTLFFSEKTNCCIDFAKFIYNNFQLFVDKIDIANNSLFFSILQKNKNLSIDLFDKDVVSLANFLYSFKEDLESIEQFAHHFEHRLAKEDKLIKENLTFYLNNRFWYPSSYSDLEAKKLSFQYLDQNFNLPVFYKNFERDIPFISSSKMEKFFSEDFLHVFASFSELEKFDKKQQEAENGIFLRQGNCNLDLVSTMLYLLKGLKERDQAILQPLSYCFDFIDKFRSLFLAQNYQEAINYYFKNEEDFIQEAKKLIAPNDFEEKVKNSEETLENISPVLHSRLKALVEKGDLIFSLENFEAFFQEALFLSKKIRAENEMIMKKHKFIDPTPDYSLIRPKKTSS